MWSEQTLVCVEQQIDDAGIYVAAHQHLCLSAVSDSDKLHSRRAGRNSADVAILIGETLNNKLRIDP